MSAEKTLLDQIKDQVAKECFGNSNFDYFYKSRDKQEMHELMTIVCERYYQAKAQALQDFKDYVHKRLDDAGIEKDPESEHKAAGCRIGGRLDIVLSKTHTREQVQASCEATLKKASENAELGYSILSPYNITIV